MKHRGTYCGWWLRNPNHQLIDGQNPMIYRGSTIVLVVQDCGTIYIYDIPSGK